jgi:hypothetical protein
MRNKFHEADNRFLFSLSIFLSLSLEKQGSQANQHVCMPPLNVNVNVLYTFIFLFGFAE